MSRLLTMALVETTRDPASYAVAAYDIDEETWVYFKGILWQNFSTVRNPVWDIFSITEAEYVEQRRGRPQTGNRQSDKLLPTSHHFAHNHRSSAPAVVGRNRKRGRAEYLYEHRVLRTYPRARGERRLLSRA